MGRIFQKKARAWARIDKVRPAEASCEEHKVRRPKQPKPDRAAFLNPNHSATRRLRNAVLGGKNEIKIPHLRTWRYWRQCTEAFSHLQDGILAVKFPEMLK